MLGKMTLLTMDKKDKGIFLIANENADALSWKNDKFFTEDAYAEYQKNGTPMVPERMLLVFNHPVLAYEYMKHFEIQGGKVMQILGQEKWDWDLDAAKKNGMKRAILNRCMREETHECSMTTFNFDVLTDFHTAEKLLVDCDSAGEGYDNRFT